MMIPEIRKDSFFHKHGLSLALGFVFAVFTITTLVTGRIEYAAEQTAHGEDPASGFMLWWLFEYSMSLVADVFGGLLLVLFTKKWIERGSAASK